MRSFLPNLFKSTQKALSMALFVAFLVGPFSPVISFPQAVFAASLGDLISFDTTGSSTWTVPVGVTSVKVKTWGAGGAGGNQVSSFAGQGGGAGGYAEATISVTAGSNHTITVGAGGSVSGASRNGGSSSFDSSVAANGGIGGANGDETLQSIAQVDTQCSFEGTWVYNDEGGGNDFGVTCRSSKLTGFCNITAANGLGRGLHAFDYTCEQGSTPSIGTKCDFEGTQTYTDEGSGNDLSFTCRTGKVTGYCGSTGLPRGVNPGNYSCEYGQSVSPSAPVCNFDGTWSYTDEGNGNDFAITCRSSRMVGWCGATPLQRGGPQVGNYVCAPAADAVGTPSSFDGAGGVGTIGSDLQSGGSAAAVTGSTHTTGGIAYASGPGNGGDGASSGNGLDGGNGRVTVEIMGLVGDQAPQGFTDGADCSTFGGWAFDPDDQSANLTINFYSGGPVGSGTLVATTVANNPRPDVNTSAGVIGDHGYSILTPDSLKDNQSHDIYAYAINSDSANTGNNVLLMTSGATLIDHRTISGCNIPVPPVNPNISSVSIAVSPNPITIPFGGSVQVAVNSTATVTNNGVLTQHGVEMSVNGGAWTNAGAWNNPLSNTFRASDASFTGLNISTAGTYDFRTYASIDGVNYTYSSVVTVIASASNPPSSLSAVSIAVSPNPVTIPFGGNVQLTVTSTATVSGNAALTQHGIEMNANSTGWINAGAWNSPISNTLRTSDASFTTLSLSTAGSYDLRTYASIDGVNYVYSSVANVVASSSTNHAPVISSVVGNATGTVNVSYAFTATATDQDGDTVQYGFDWNNNGAIDTGLGEAWTSLVPSGTPTSGSNIWTVNGTHSFQVLARDSNGAVVSYPSSIVISGGASNIGFTVATSSTGFFTSETGGTTSFTIVLASAPLADVTLPIMSGDMTEGTTSASSVTFTPANWNVSQTITITGVDDVLFDGDINYSVTIGPSTSSDVNYNNLPGQTISLTNFDNEINPGTGGSVSTFSINPTSITSGGTATLSWTATNATLCIASGSWTGVKNPASGTEVVGPFTATSTVTNTFIINCGNSNGTTTASTTLTINPLAATTTPPVTSSSSGGGSGGGGGHSGPCIGFGCVSPVTAPDVMILIDTPTTSGSGSSVPNPAKACNYADFITTFMRRSVDNNPNEVKKIQYFLNKYEGASLELNGTFDEATENAVKAFQVAHANEVLSPWGTDVPTGIVYITTTAAINRIFCGDNPNYRGDDDIKDIINPVLYTPVDNSSQFENVVGSATTSTSTNLASVFGAISGDILKLLKGIPWYELFLMLLVLLGTGFITQGIFKKDIFSQKNTAVLVNGLTMLIIGSVLNVLNTLSFIIRPEWFASHVGMNPSWLLGLDAINILSLVVISSAILFAIHKKLLSSSSVK